MAGDKINIFGQSYWFNGAGNYSDKYPIPVISILDALLGIAGMAGKGLTTAGITTTGLTDALDAFRTRTDAADAPWAYINNSGSLFQVKELYILLLLRFLLVSLVTIV